MEKLKPCRITNCPSYVLGGCHAPSQRCEEIMCPLKKMLQKPKDRITYIKNKLSSCYGYNEDEKKIRYEELNWVLKEFCDILNIEVLEDGSWELVKESFQKR